MLNRKKGAVGEIKFVFDIQVNSVTLKKPGQNLEKDCTVSVLIERGGKHYINTTEKEAKVGSTGDAVVIIAESLSLEATMYQEASGLYQEKVAKVTVRKKKRGMMQSHVSIGQTTLSLHSIIEEGNQPIDRSFFLEQCTFPGSQIQLVIRFRRLDGKPALAISDSQKLTNGDAESNVNSHNHLAASDAQGPAPSQKPLRPVDTEKPVPKVQPDSPPVPPSFTTTNDPFAGDNIFASPHHLDRQRQASTDSQQSDIFKSAVDGSAVDFDPFVDPFGTPNRLSGNPSKHSEGIGFDNWHSSDNSLIAPPLTSNPLPLTSNPPPLTSNPPPLPSNPSPLPSNPPPIPSNPPPIPSNPPSIPTAFEVGTELALKSSSPPSIPNNPPPVSNKRVSRPSPGNPFAPAKPATTTEKLPALPPHPEASETETMTQHHAPVVPVVPSVPTKVSNTVDYEALLAAKDEEIALMKSGLVSQDEKLLQAGKHITFQDAQVATLNSELETLRAQFEECQAKLTVAHDPSKVEELEKVIIAQETKLQQAKGFIDHQHQEIAGLQASLVTTEAQLTEFQTRLVQAKEYIDYQTEQIATLEAQIAELRATTSENSESTANIEEMETRLNQAVEHIRSQDSQLTEAKDEIERLKKVLSTSHSDSEFEELRQALVKEEAEKEEAKNNLAVLQSKLTETLGYFEDAKAELARFDREEEARNTAATDGTNAITTSDSTEKAELEEKLQQAADYIAFQEEQIADWESKYSTLQSEMMEVQAQLLEAHSEGAEREATSSSAAGSEEITNALAKAKDDIDTYRAQLQLLQAEVEDKERELYDAQDEIAALQRQLRSKPTSTTDSISAPGSNSSQNSMEIEQRLQEMQQKVDQAKEFIAYQDEQMASKDEELLQLQNQLSYSQSTIQTKEQELLRAQVQLKDLQEQLEIIEAQSQGLEKELRTSKLDLVTAQNEIKQLKEAFAVTSAPTVDLHSQSQLQEMQEKINQAQVYIAYQDEVIAKKEEQTAELQQTMAASVQTMEALRTALAEKESAVKSKISEQNALKETVLGLEKELQMAKSHQSEAQNEHVVDLQAKIDQAKEFIAYQDEQLAEKDTDIARLSEELKAEKTQSSQLSASMTKGMQEYQALAQSVEKVKAQLAKKTDECKALTAQLASLQQGEHAKTEELQQKINQAKDYIAYQDETLAAKEEDMTQLQDEISTLRRTLVDKERTLKTSLDQQEDLKDGIKVLEEALKQQQGKQGSAAKELQEKIVQAKDFIAFQDEQIAAKDAEIARLTQELTAAKAQAAELSASMNKGVVEFKQAQTQLQELQKKLANQELEWQRSQTAKVDSKQQEAAKLQELQTKIDQAKDFIAYQDEQLAEKDAEMADLQKQLIAKEQALNEMKAMASKKNSPANHGTNGHGGTTDLTIQQQEEEIKTLKEKLDQAKEYIIYIEEQLDEQKATSAIGRGSGNGNDSSSSARRLTEDVTAFRQILRAVATKLLSLLPEKSRREMTTALERMHAETLPAKDVGPLMISLLDTVAGYYIDATRSSSSSSSSSPKPSPTNVGGDAAAAAAAYQSQLAEKENQVADVQEHNRMLEEELRRLNVRLKNIAATDPTADDVHIYEATMQQLAEKLLALLPEKTRRTLPPISSLRSVPARERAPLMSALLDSVTGYYAQLTTTTTGGAGTGTGPGERQQQQLQELQERLQRELLENDKLIDEVIRVKMELAAANDAAERERHRAGMLTKRLHQAGLQA
jgi:chromosome segregation ATPase